MNFSFRNMLFDGLVNLCDQFEEYLQDPNYKLVVGEVESELYVNQESTRIEAAIGYLTRGEIDSTIHHISTLAPTIHKVHYLSYLSSINHGDYSGAVDKLHQFFDYTIQSRIQPASEEFRAVGPWTVFSSSILNMAAVHLKFGHFSEALELVWEALHVAQQQSNDDVLEQALSLLACLLSQITPQEPLEWQKNILLNALERSEKLNDGPLIIQNLTNLAILLLKYPRAKKNSLMIGHHELPKINLELIWKLLDKAMEISNTVSSSNLAADLQCSIILTKMRTWNLIGNIQMTRLTSQLLIEKNLLGNGNHEVSSLALETIANLEAQSGNWLMALKLIVNAQKLFPLSVSQSSWTISARQILHQLALQNRDFTFCSFQLERLFSIWVPLGSLSHHVDTWHRLAVTLIHFKGYYCAFGAIIQLIRSCWHMGMIVQTVGLYLTLAELFVSQKAYTDSLPYVLTCISYCKQYNLNSIYSAAVCLFAEIHLSKKTMQAAQRALRLLNRVTPDILKNGAAYLNAKLYLVKAKAIYLHLANQYKGYQLKEDVQESIIDTNNNNKSQKLSSPMSTVKEKSQRFSRTSTTKEKSQKSSPNTTKKCISEKITNNSSRSSGQKKQQQQQQEYNQQQQQQQHHHQDGEKPLETKIKNQRLEVIKNLDSAFGFASKLHNLDLMLQILYYKARFLDIWDMEKERNDAAAHFRKINSQKNNFTITSSSYYLDSNVIEDLLRNLKI